MRFVPRKVALCAFFAASLAFSLLPGVAAADDPDVVPFFGLGGCLANDGKATVTADETFYLRFGWGAKTRGQVMEYIRAASDTITIDGTVHTDAGDYWGDIFFEPGPPAHWRAWVFYPVEAPSAGETLSVTLDLIVSHRLHDGISKLENGRFEFVGPGNWLTVSCEITAA